MDARTFISIFESFYYKFPHPRVKKIFSFIILAFLRMRKEKNFTDESVMAVVFFNRQMVKFASLFEGEELADFRIEAMRFLQSFMGFSDFSDDDEIKLREYFGENIQALEGSLEEHIQKVFNLEQLTPFAEQYDDHYIGALEYAAAWILAPAHEESFSLIGQKEDIDMVAIADEIISFYRKQGFKVRAQESGNIRLKKAETHEHVAIAFEVGFGCVHFFVVRMNFGS